MCATITPETLGSLINFNMKVVHSWLKEYIGDALPEASKLEELLTFHAFEVDGVEEVAGETVIDVDILPNRSSDCLSHRGVAREIATILDTKLEKDILAEPVEMATGSKVSVTVEDVALCERFTAAVVTGVKVSESPEWLKQRLEALGQRSINNVVDATNYVMFALGQPTHAFDYDKLAKAEDGVANITVRLGKEGESLTLLTGEEINSDTEVLHLADGISGTALDLAGIKGGVAAELTDDTTNIVVTSGNFNYQKVRLTSQRLRVQTDASQRFQNQPSPELAGYGLKETVDLILVLAGGECDGIVESYPNPPTPATTTFTLTHTNSLLGLELSMSDVTDIMRRIGAEVSSKTEDTLTVISPWGRTDLHIPEDYIEEVGRIHGLNEIESILPEPTPVTAVNKRQYYTDLVRETLVTSGYNEVITTSFHKKGDIKLRNAMASDKSYIRGSLSKNIHKVLDQNYNHLDLLGVSAVRVFEIGTVFFREDGGVKECVNVSIGVRTKGNGYNPKDDEALTEATAEVDEVLGQKLEWNIEKGVAEANLTALLEKLPVPSTYQPLAVVTAATYKPVSMYPASSRDIAMWISGETDSSVIEKTLRNTAGNLCVRITLFDNFTKDGKTSYAFRLVFQSFQKTLTDIEVNKIMGKIYEVVKANNWEVR